MTPKQQMSHVRYVAKTKENKMTDIQAAMEILHGDIRHSTEVRLLAMSVLKRAGLQY